MAGRRRLLPVLLGLGLALLVLAVFLYVGSGLAEVALLQAWQEPFPWRTAWSGLLVGLTLALLVNLWQRTRSDV
ncbi:hypothetical protein KTAU_28860 [Thermogemmatispora aurantia]|uniref:hypothetical protein n=1 Tax=Thermogemmatispora aurantia TaxID=2045279 RepID=UPI00124F5CF3|nr:hypothetical protein [Thermogemmatispora aurantia]GER84250.1 hypothetical protein KTAU_28860 [Thermogemmatispora aurantia]